MHCRLIVYMEPRLEGEFGNNSRRYVDEFHRWVIGVDMSSAGLAPLAITYNGFIICARVFVECGNIIRAPGDLDGVRSPQGEGTDGSC